MISDHLIIAQILSAVFAFGLLAVAAVSSWPILRKWDIASTSELQLTLERKTYLASTIIQYVLFFQIITLLVFLSTVNDYLPGVIKGAMCATGTLSVNDFGYPLLLIKLLAIFFYGAYLFLNFLDNRETGYPLTPLKYYLVFPALVISGVDLFLTISYFSQIEPDIIATCCSISFSDSGSGGAFILPGEEWKLPGLVIFYHAAILLMILATWFRKNHWTFGAVGIIYLVSAVYVLKIHFAKYIYGLPSHQCLFDMFWSAYNFAGYWLFGALIATGMSVVFLILISKFRQRLQLNADVIEKRLLITMNISILLFALSCTFYWLNWIYLR